MAYERTNIAAIKTSVNIATFISMLPLAPFHSSWLRLHGIRSGRKLTAGRAKAPNTICRCTIPGLGEPIAPLKSVNVIRADQ